MKLILTGGGDSDNFQQIDTYFISLLPKKPTLLFIPLAGDSNTFDDGLERILQTFSTIHFHNIEMCIDLNSLDWNYLKKFSAIYIDGGNTFRLMDQVRKSHFYELIRKFLHHGGVINGDSAGAIILGSHLETAHFGQVGDENESGLISYQGLNLMGDWAIHCHYEKNDDFEIEKFTNEVGLPVIALSEETGISITKETISIFGSASLKIFNFNGKTEELFPGETFTYAHLV